MSNENEVRYIKEHVFQLNNLIYKLFSNDNKIQIKVEVVPIVEVGKWSNCPIINIKILKEL
jgi:hypothetical protein